MAKTKKKAAPVAKAVAKKGKKALSKTPSAGGAKSTVGAVARAALLEGKSSEQVIKAVKSKFPDSKINEAGVAWYRRELRKEGHGSKLEKLQRGRKPIKKAEASKKPSKKKSEAPKKKSNKEAASPKEEKADDMGI